MPEDRQDIAEGVSTDASQKDGAASAQAAASGAAPYATLEELGAALAKLRTDQGLTVADVAGRLMLAESLVEAMEKGQIAQKRPAVYAKGFLRAYAQAVRMPKELFEPLLASLAEDKSVLEKPYFTPNKTARLPHTSPVWGILASLLVTVCAVWLLWHFNVLDHVFKMKETVAPTAVPMQNYETASREPAPQAGEAARAGSGDAAKDVARQDVSRPEAAKDSAKEATKDSLVQPVQKDQPSAGSSFNGSLLPGNMQKPVLQETVPGGSGKTAPAGSPSQSLAPDRPETAQEYLPAVVPPNSPWAALQGNATLAGEAGMASQAPAAAQPANPNLPDQSVAQNGKHTVTIMAESQCWTQVTADSGRPAQRTLQPGESMSVPFDTSLTLRLGNAGGVKVFYDGIEQTDRGRVGQVRTLNFPPAPVE